MKKKGKPVKRTGDFEKERQRIVREYADGDYLKTLADLACAEEQKKQATYKEEEHYGNN